MHSQVGLGLSAEGTLLVTTAFRFQENKKLHRIKNTERLVNSLIDQISLDSKPPANASNMAL